MGLLLRTVRTTRPLSESETIGSLYSENFRHLGGVSGPRGSVSTTVVRGSSDIYLDGPFAEQRSHSAVSESPLSLGSLSLGSLH